MGGGHQYHSRSLMNRLSRLLLLAALMISIGGQWMVLQGVAWVGMAVTYSVSEGSVSAGLSKTFDGDHPCPMCLAVREGAQDEDSKGVPASGKGGKVKAEIATDSTGLVLSRADGVFQGIESWEPAVVVRLIAPDVPPPRLAA